MKKFTQSILLATLTSLGIGYSNVASAQVLLKELNTATNMSSNPDQFTNIGGVMYFHTKMDDGARNQIWKSDGTAAGTVILKDSIINSNVGNVVQLINVNGTLFYIKNPNNGTGANVAEIWKSDGTTAGTIFLDSLATASPLDQVGDAQPRNYTPVGNKLFFQMGKGSGFELWVTDGSVKGVHQVVDLAPGSQGNYKYGGLLDAPMVAFNGKLYFKGSSTGMGDNELYVSDGTAAGTKLVKDINPGSGSSDPGSWVVYNNELYFSANGGIWKTDGTGANTTLVTTGAFSNPVVFKNAIYFPRGNDLWKTDGTAAGTVFVTDSTNIISGANADYLIAAYAKSISTPPYVEMHYKRTDGTTTTSVSTKVGYGASFTVLNNKMYWSGVGNGMWASDGTEAGSSQVATNLSGNFNVFNGNLYYNGWTSAPGHGYELWWLAGTPATGLNSISKEETSLVYPNPSSGMVTCVSSTKFSEIKIYDLLGAVIYTGKIGAEKTEINLTEQPKGVYFYRMSSDNQREEVGKIIIE